MFSMNSWSSSSSSLTRPRIVSLTFTSLLILAGMANSLAAQTLLEIVGEEFPYFRRYGDMIDVAGVDSTNHPVIRTYDLSKAGQPLENTASPYADTEFQFSVGVTNFSPTGQYIGIHALGLAGAEEFTRRTTLFSSPDYDTETILPGMVGVPTEATLATMVSDAGGAVGNLDGGQAAIWTDSQSNPTILGVGNVTDAPSDLSVAIGISTGELVGSNAFRPVIWIDPLGENRMEVLDVGPLDPLNSASVSLIRQDMSTIIAQRATPSVDRFPIFVSMLLTKDTDGAPTSASEYSPVAIFTPDTELLAGRPAALLDEGLPISFYNATDTDDIYVVDERDIANNRVTAQLFGDWLGTMTDVPAEVAQAEELLDVHWTGHDRLGMTLRNGDNTIFFEFNANSSAGPGDVNADGSIDANDIDAMTFLINSPHRSLYFDLTNDGSIDAEDRNHLITELLGSVAGDSNLDGLFTTTDLVVAFQAGGYENPDAGISTWRNGDWNGDLVFDSSDLVAAFVTGAFDANAASPAAVPEPVHNAAWLVPLACLLFRNRIGRRS